MVVSVGRGEEITQVVYCELKMGVQEIKNEELKIKNVLCRELLFLPSLERIGISMLLIFRKIVIGN